MYEFPFGKSELQGVANRGNYDLTQHAKASGRELDYFDDETGEKLVPHVIEPSIGVDRSSLVFLLEAYDEDQAPNAKGGVDTRTVLRFDPRLAPVKVAVLPLIGKDPGMTEQARGLYEQLRRLDAETAAFRAGARIPKLRHRPHGRERPANVASVVVDRHGVLTLGAHSARWRMSQASGCPPGTSPVTASPITIE